MNSSIMKVMGEEALRQNTIETTKRLGVELTQAEFDALTQEEKTHGTYYIKDGQMSGSTGSVVYVTTSNTALYGKSVTLTDDSVSVVSQFDNEGNASFQAVAFTGRLMVESSDGTTTYFEAFNAPYYGKYSVAISTKVKITATLSISTSSSELYGKTITIKKDNEVVGTTAFSSGGSASYVVHETGEYTAECEGYSGSATVSAETTYNVTINAGLDLAAWITAGSTTDYPLNPSSYADFSALEADEAAVRQLMLVHDAVDYLATASAGDSLMQSVIGSDVCAKWINLSDYALDTLYANSDIADEMDTADKYGYGEWGIIDSTTTPPTWGALGNVPIMTANNAPYGVVSASRVYNAYYAYAAFDGNINGNGWIATSSGLYATGDYLTYTSVNPIKAKKANVYYKGQSVGTQTLYFKIQGSNDGFASDIHDLCEEQTFNIPAKDATDMKSVELNADTYYMHHRIYITRNAASTNGYGLHLQFYGRELELTPLIPTMTGNNTPKGEATADSVYSASFYPYFAFTGLNSGDRWCSARSAAIHWVKYEFDEPVQIDAIGIGAANYGTPVASAYTVQVSNDNFASNIVTVADDITIGDDNYIYNYRTFNDTTKYKYMRVISNSATNEMIISGFQAYAASFDYSEKEFATGSTRKTIYDHGVAPSGAITGGTKNPDCLTLSAVGTATVTIDKGTRTYMGGKAGLHASGTNRLKCGSGYSAFTASNMPDSNGFDISSISGSVAVGIEQTASGTFDCTEIWIE